MKRNNLMKKQRVITHEETKNYHSMKKRRIITHEEVKNYHSIKKRKLVRALNQSEEQLNNAHKTTLQSKLNKNNIAK